jgi:hypothetical protein
VEQCTRFAGEEMAVQESWAGQLWTIVEPVVVLEKRLSILEQISDMETNGRSA